MFSQYNFNFVSMVSYKNKNTDTQVTFIYISFSPLFIIMIETAEPKEGQCMVSYEILI